jgi:hypothetical protein
VKQIYALLDGEPRSVVYVGCTNDIVKRIKSHWRQRNSTYRSPVKNWLCNLAEPPEYYVFEEVADDISHAAEQYYIEIIRQVNPQLLNVLDGQKKRWETRDKISKSLAGVGVGKIVSAETRQKLAKKSSEHAKNVIFTCKTCGNGPFTLNGLGIHRRYQCKLS